MEITTLNSSDFNSNAFRALNEEQQLKQTAQQFEAILFRQMLDKSLKPIFKSDLLGENNATEIYRSFMVDSLSQSIASTSPLQLEKLLPNKNHEDYANH